MSVQNFQKLGVGVWRELAGRGPLLQNPPSVADVPIILVQLPMNQLGVRELGQIFAKGLSLIMNDLIDSPVAAIDAIVILGRVRQSIL